MALTRAARPGNSERAPLGGTVTFALAAQPVVYRSTNKLAHYRLDFPGNKPHEPDD